MITRSVVKYTVDAVVKVFDDEGNVKEQTVQASYRNLKKPETVTELAVRDIKREYPGSFVYVGNVTTVTEKYSMEDEFFYANAKEEIIE